MLLMKILLLSLLIFSQINSSEIIGKLDDRLDPIVTETFGERLAQPTIIHTKIAQGIDILSCASVCGNILLISGPRGAVMVNTMLAKMHPWIKSVMRRNVGIDMPRIIISSNHHFWNADGNSLFGGQMHFMISQENARQSLLSTSTLSNLNIIQDYYQVRHTHNAGARVTFDDEMKLHFNKEDIYLYHFGSASSTGDTIIFFQGRNVLFLGDLYFSNALPYVNTVNGGSVKGIIKSLDESLQLIDDKTIVIPGIGTASTKSELADYLKSLKELYQTVQELVDKNKSVTDILNDISVTNYLKTFSDNAISNKENFINSIILETQI